MNRWTNQLGGVWAILLIWILARMLQPQDTDADFTRLLVEVSLVFPLYYLAVSWIITWRIVRRAQRQAHLHAQTDTEPRPAAGG